MASESKKGKEREKKCTHLHADDFPFFSSFFSCSFFPLFVWSRGKGTHKRKCASVCASVCVCARLGEYEWEGERAGVEAAQRRRS